ncbi:MAG: hypothetical protein ACFE94_11880 [Candidatus Hodarchaeota archaeon]
MVSNKFVLISAYLVFLSGILHLVVTILSRGLIEIAATTLIFAILFLLSSLIMVIRIRKNQLDATRRIVIWNTTITLLNSVTISTNIITRTPENRIIVYIFLILIVIISLICFLTFFIKKTELDKMDGTEKLSFFSIAVIKGLGVGLLFNVLAWVGLINDVNPLMIVYILVFGTLNMIYGELLYRRKEVRKIQIRALIVLILGLTTETILCIFFVNAKSIVDIFLYIKSSLSDYIT